MKKVKITKGKSKFNKERKRGLGRKIKLYLKK